jgi:hypothetical protein
MSRSRTLHTTIEMRVCSAEWMSFLRDMHGRLAYTYRLDQTVDDVRKEVMLALDCVNEDEIGDEEEEMSPGVVD